jgi:hypothetical protein
VIEVTKIEELPDGSALCTLIVSIEAQKVLMQVGLVALLEEMIEKDKVEQSNVQPKGWKA